MRSCGCPVRAKYGKDMRRQKYSSAEINPPMKVTEITSHFFATGDRRCSAAINPTKRIVLSRTAASKAHRLFPGKMTAHC